MEELINTISLLTYMAYLSGQQVIPSIFGTNQPIHLPINLSLEMILRIRLRQQISKIWQ